MSSVLYSVLIGCMFAYSANACDIRFEEVPSKESKSLRVIKLPNNHIGSGAVVEMTTEKEKKDIVLSCNHIFLDYLYDHFNEPEYFMEIDKAKTTKKSVCSKDFCRCSFDYMRLTSPLYSDENFIINKTKSRKNIALRIGYNMSFDNYQCENYYLSFCMASVPLPIDMACILPINQTLSGGVKFTLPSDEVIDSWSKGVQEVVAYGHSKTQCCEYKMTCNMKLSSDGEWFICTSVISAIDDFFRKCAGMSGGPCFIRDSLCGVVSGFNGQGYIFIKAITKKFVHALKSIIGEI